MKKSVQEHRNTEARDERKRRLARERQRRHREKIRARSRADAGNPRPNTEAGINVTERSPNCDSEEQERRNSENVTAGEEAEKKKIFNEGGFGTGFPPPTEARQPLQKFSDRESLPNVKMSRKSPRSASEPTPDSSVRRTERQYSSKHSRGSEIRGNGEKSPQQAFSRQAEVVHNQRDNQQYPPSRQFASSHRHFDDRQRPEAFPQRVTSQHLMESRRQCTSHDRTSHVHLLRETPSRKEQNRFHLQDVGTSRQNPHRLEPPVRQTPFDRPVPSPNQTRHFQSTSRGFSSCRQDSPQAQHQQQHDSELAFSASGPASSQHMYPNDPSRQYIPETAMHQDVSTRPFHRYGFRPRSSMNDAAISLTTLPSAGHGMQQTIVGIPSVGQHGDGHGNLGITRGMADMKYPQSSTAAIPAVQQHSSHLEESRDASDALDSFAHHSDETAEERKRRLARERQRRRRKRLKKDPGARETEECSSIRRFGPDSARVVITEPETTQNSTLDLSMQIRGTEANVPSHSSGQMHASLGNLETTNLTTSPPVPGGVQGVHSTGVEGAQDELPGSSQARVGFNHQTLAMTGVNTPSATGPGLSAHGGVRELKRTSFHSDEKSDRPRHVNEDADARKRRLARDRQRRRRERLKCKKHESGEYRDSTAADEKDGGEAFCAKLADNVEARTISDSERRVPTSEGVGESDKLPLSSPHSSYGRADVAHSLSFGDQGRAVRTHSMPEGTVPGMAIALAGSTMLNMPHMHVNGVGMHAQSLIHWSQAFPSEESALLAVERAVGAFRDHLAAGNPAARLYVVQRGVEMLLAPEDATRDLINGSLMPALRPEAVMRL